MKKLNLNENFISRIWVNDEYYSGLKTTGGKDVKIINYGVPNFDSGADFAEATLQIDGVLYSGDVEIHRSYKDWDVHKHRENPRYNKVILQVVFWPDDEAVTSAHSDRVIPTVVLSNFLTRSIHEIWKEIINNPSPKFRLPCFGKNSAASAEFKKEWINDTGMLRLNYRAGRLKSRIESLENDSHSASKKEVWEKVLFEFVLEALGFSKNKPQFLTLAESIDINKLKPYSSVSSHLEAVLFGTAGFLSGECNDDYCINLTALWKSLLPKLKFETMHRSEWNFFRLRPMNFPTRRIAYASAFLREIISEDLLKRIVFCFKNSGNIPKDLNDIFLSIAPSPYWNDHYDFGKAGKTKQSAIGKERIDSVMVNVIIPLMYLYAKVFGDEDLFIKVKKLYRKGKDNSTNSVIKVMKSQLEFSPESICESQGLIHLHNFFCVHGNCGECKIGEKVFEKFAVSEALRIIIY